MADEKKTPEAPEKARYRYVADHGQHVVGDVVTLAADDPLVLAGVVVPEKG